MAPGNSDRHSSHTGTIPKSKVRNNCNVPQEVVTPTRRDMTSNLVTTSLDWVPVSEYNARANYNQTRKRSNNSSDHDLTDLDNSVSFESGFGRFVPVRPQPRALPLNAQNRDNIAAEHSDDGAGGSVTGSITGHNLHTYTHQLQNGMIPHTNHAAAAVMIVNPTTPNAPTGNIAPPFNAPNQNRNNLTRNLNTTRNNFEGNIHASNNNTTPTSSTRTGTKTVNLINNMYDQVQGNFNNLNENNQGHRESARALGEAIVAACPDAASVERRLGQIREYIRVTSSLVDTMRNSEDEAFIEHTKEEYDELIGMVKSLKESESKLESILKENIPENDEVPTDVVLDCPGQPTNDVTTGEKSDKPDKNINQDKTCNIKNTNDNTIINNNLKKITNIENEQFNVQHDLNKVKEPSLELFHISEQITDDSKGVEGTDCSKPDEEVLAVVPYDDQGVKKEDENLNEALRKNILSCVEKAHLIEEIKIKNNDTNSDDNKEVVVRPVSVQSNGSAYSENELWQNEIKNKMEMSQLRLAALKQQQKRLLKYQEEAKQQLEEINRERQSQEIRPSTSHDNLSVMQGQSLSNYQHNRMYAANQIGVATTLPHSSDTIHSAGISNNLDGDHGHLVHSNDDRLQHGDTNIDSNEDMIRGGEDSEAEEDEGLLSEQGRLLQHKLRELQLKKQHMESLVSEFQKLQMATRTGSSRNTYSSSGEDSADDEPSRKCNKPGRKEMKNDDPYKLMEIKAIRAALQKTKDLMRSVENYEVEHLSGVPDEFQSTPHSNIHDNKSEGGGSTGGWSNEGSVCRVRNSLSQRHKFTNEQSQQQAQHQQQQQQQQQQNHEANIASLQELAQELRMETEKIMGERARIKDMVSAKDRKQKKVNEEVRAGPSGAGAGGLPGPAERQQMQLRALLADKQRELEALLNKEKRMSTSIETQKLKTDSLAASVVNQSYNSEQEEPTSRSEQIVVDSQDSRENENYRGAGDSSRSGRSVNVLPSHLASTYASDSDSATRIKSNQRPRARRRQSQEHQLEDNALQANNTNTNIRLEPRVEQGNVNMVPPISQNGDSPGNVPYPYLQQPCWSTNKSNQDMRTNQFTQNSHSQTMERLLGTPQMSFQPSMPFNVMMPYGMVGGCGCGCGFWGAWCWQQLVLQQREIQQLREQLNHLEERWRSDNASHTLNNQVPPGNRANNYWDNFRSYSRQNLLSTNSKTNADSHLSAGPAHNPHPLTERSHNTLHHTTTTPPSNTPKRNTNTATSTITVQQPTQTNTDEPNRTSCRNNAYERSLSFSSTPDVLNINQNSEPDSSVGSHTRNQEDTISVTNVNLNRQEVPSNSFRNLNITNPIPEIIQSHSNNLNTSANSKKKSSSKLPAKNSTNRRNASLSYSETNNVNTASISEAPNPNLASTSREVHDKASSKLFDLLRENIYSEVTALIGVNESHPDFLIQLFRELQLISSEPLRQKVLQSIRNVLSQYSTIVENHNTEEENRIDIPGASIEMNNYSGRNSTSSQNACTSTVQIDNNIVHFLLQRCDEICTPEFLEALALHIVNNSDGRQPKKRLLDFLSKYEGIRVCDVSSDILENLSLILSNNEGDESTQLTSEISESSILQDVAGSLNLFSSSDTQLHQLNACPYEIWPGHVHMDMETTELNDNTSPRSSQEGKVDLINCADMHNGDLAEADQTCHEIPGVSREETAQVETLPDVVDTEEATPTEAEAEWLGLDRVPTRLHMEESSGKQKD